MSSFDRCLSNYTQTCGRSGLHPLFYDLVQGVQGMYDVACADGTQDQDGKCLKVIDYSVQIDFIFVSFAYFLICRFSVPPTRRLLSVCSVDRLPGKGSAVW